MKKALGVTICLMLLIFSTSCGKKNETSKNQEKKEEVSEESKVEKTTSDYKVEFKEKTRDIKNKISATYNVVELTNSKKNKESEKISSYLNDKVKSLYEEYENIIKNEYVKDASYIFDFKYSLEDQNDYYITFKLTYYYQQGSPYQIDAEEYYMFNKSDGEIVKFDTLFTNDVKDKVYESVVKYLEKIYKESEIEYNPDDYDLKNSMFNEGYFILKDNKLSFSFPRSIFTAAAFGSIKIDIDEKIYKEYIKDIK